jgi:hypothetical protein
MRCNTSLFAVSRRLGADWRDGRHDAGDAAFDLGERFAVAFGVRAALVVLPVEFCRIVAHGVGHGIGGNELFRQSGQNAALDVVAAAGVTIVAGAAAVPVQAPVPVTGDDAVPEEGRRKPKEGPSTLPIPDTRLCRNRISAATIPIRGVARPVGLWKPRHPDALTAASMVPERTPLPRVAAVSRARFADGRHALSRTFKAAARRR